MRIILLALIACIGLMIPDTAGAQDAKQKAKATCKFDLQKCIARRTANGVSSSRAASGCYKEQADRCG